MRGRAQTQHKGKVSVVLLLFGVETLGGANLGSWSLLDCRQKLEPRTQHPGPEFFPSLPIPSTSALGNQLLRVVRR